MAESQKDKISRLSKQLQEVDVEIVQLQTLIESSQKRLKSLSEIAFEVLRECLIEMHEGVYILSGRLPDNLVHSLKAKGIIRFDTNDFLWYVDDISQFVKRIEFRIKRNLDVSCMYSYKNVSEYRYEERLSNATAKFYKISDEIECLEKWLQGELRDPLHLYSEEDRESYKQITANLTKYQQEFEELTNFLESIEHIPTSVFTLLAKQQETLSKEITKSNELLQRIKNRYS